MFNAFSMLCNHTFHLASKEDNVIVRQFLPGRGSHRSELSLWVHPFWEWNDMCALQHRHLLSHWWTFELFLYFDQRCVCYPNTEGSDTNVFGTCWLTGLATLGAFRSKWDYVSKTKMESNWGSHKTWSPGFQTYACPHVYTHLHATPPHTHVCSQHRRHSFSLWKIL